MLFRSPTPEAAAEVAEPELIRKVREDEEGEEGAAEPGAEAKATEAKPKAEKPKGKDSKES